MDNREILRVIYLKVNKRKVNAKRHGGNKTISRQLVRSIFQQVKLGRSKGWENFRIDLGKLGDSRLKISYPNMIRLINIIREEIKSTEPTLTPAGYEAKQPAWGLIARGLTA